MQINLTVRYDIRNNMISKRVRQIWGLTDWLSGLLSVHHSDAVHSNSIFDLLPWLREEDVVVTARLSSHAENIPVTCPSICRYECDAVRCFKVVKTNQYPVRGIRYKNKHVTAQIPLFILRDKNDTLIGMGDAWDKSYKLLFVRTLISFPCASFVPSMACSCSFFSLSLSIFSRILFCRLFIFFFDSASSRRR